MLSSYKSFLLCIALFVACVLNAQKSLSKLLKKYNTESIPYITVEELSKSKDDAILLDSRELKEYETSHLENAICVGYDNFEISTVTKKIEDKTKKIVVYCSLGIRSEDVAEKLKDQGYTNVYNLYGGIFEWKNNDLEVYDTNNKKTEEVHTFSKEWSKWLEKGKKIYPKH